MLSFHVSFCAPGSSQRGAGAEIRERSSCPGLNPAAVSHGWGGCAQEEERLLWVYPAPFILSAVVFRDGMVVVSGSGSKCQKGDVRR